MIGLTNAGGGIDRLKLRVYNVASAPSTPKRNDIKVDVPTNDFEWALLGKNDTWGNVANRVRIEFQENEDNNKYIDLTYTDKRNRIYTVLCNCRYNSDGSKYKNINAWFYNGSNWVKFSEAEPEWDGTLFYNGNQYTKYTGGWTAVGGDAAVGNTLSCDTGGFAAIRSTSKVDVTKFNRLRFTCSSKFSILSDDHSAFGLKTDGINWSNCDDNYAAVLKNLNGESSGSLDISSLSGSYYVTFFVYAREGYAAGVSVNKIWLE